MSKYDFELDMNSPNSNATILKNIKPNSTVLEVGCAHGRMTKYLKETLNCDVSIIEIDKEAGEVAKQWATHSYLGPLGDVERKIEFNNGTVGSILNHVFNRGATDYIIFADVLEHLHDPAGVLINAKQVLKSDGSIWISIPNVAYNGIISDLINDKFTYRETGLLDDTHLRFFTYHSLAKMIKKCGLKVVNEINLKNPIKYSEFKDAYTQVPSQIASFLRLRPYGEVYQFVWELKNNES